MNEAEARAALRAYVGGVGLEAWIADQPWQAASDGWTVTPEPQGWRLRLVPVPGGVRVSATAPGGGQPAVWIVKA